MVGAMHRVVVIAAFAVLAFPVMAPAGAAQVSRAPDVSRVARVEPPTVGPIVATFKQADFATYYRLDVTPAPGAPDVRIRWDLVPPENHYGCQNFLQSETSPDAAVWNHGDGDGCDHTKDGPRGHAGDVTVFISDGPFRCTARYSGTVSGTGDAPECSNVAISTASYLIFSAILDEKDAVWQMQKGIDRPGAIEAARKRLLQAKTNAIRGGAPKSAIALIDRAADLDSAALKQPRKQAIKTLRAAIELKQQARTQLRDMPL